MNGVPRTVAQLVDASVDARYVARLNELARDAVATRLAEFVEDGISLREIARRSRVSIGAVRKIASRGTADVTVGTVIALAVGLGLGTVEAVLGELGTTRLAALASGEERQVPRA